MNFVCIKFRRRVLLTFCAVGLVCVFAFQAFLTVEDSVDAVAVQTQKDAYLRWFTFNATYTVLSDALDMDVASVAAEKQKKLDWIELIAILATKYGGSFKRYRKKDMLAVAEKLKRGAEPGKIAGNEKAYAYYYEGYRAALGGLVGYYRLENATGEMVEKYGLKGYLPLAEGYGYSHYDDFGARRTYGYTRPHLGHDMMGSVGTPIVAVESGIVEALGWNMYGGWRIGIRSVDSNRYYYYAHLRKDKPYSENLQEGQLVLAGDVIGYLGMSGYSSKENVNNINTPHLHFGMQLIFDESQKEGNGEIWIDTYPIIKLLERHCSTTVKQEDGSSVRKYKFDDPTAYE